MIIVVGNCKFCYDQNCKECSNLFLDGCTKCNYGYQVDLGKCVFITCKVSHCDTCNENAFICSKCEIGYVLNNKSECDLIKISQTNETEQSNETNETNEINETNEASQIPSKTPVKSTSDCLD